MAYLTTKKVNGHTYGYIVQGKRENGKIKQEILEYLGRLDPEPDSNLKLAARVVHDTGKVSISVGRKLKGKLVLIEYKYKVLPVEFKDDVRKLIRDID